MNKFMEEAIKEAKYGIEEGHGGPFGCIIVKDDKIVGRGHNTVIGNQDCTQHGEMNAIHDACQSLGFDLKGCDMYTTGQCCTGCLCFSLWANIKHIYYACSIEDNAKIGFRDEKFDNIFEGREKLIGYEEQIDHEAGLALFDEYNKSKHTLY